MGSYVPQHAHHQQPLLAVLKQSMPKPLKLLVITTYLLVPLLLE